MGVINVTPDSFSDGGRFDTVAAAIAAATEMTQAGAAIIDVGGESTRPGAVPVAAAEEIDRVAPVIEGLRSLGVPISVDTSKPAVARAAIAAGAAMVNDVRALRAPGMLDVVANADVAVCLMHMQGEPRTMQRAPRYGDVVAEVSEFLAARAAVCVAAGIAEQRLLIDPGIGFGKTAEHNATLLRNLPELAALGLPIMVGASRKRFIGLLTGKDAAARCAGSVGAAVFAALAGAALLRVHDVEATVDALKVAAALRAANGASARTFEFAGKANGR